MRRRPPPPPAASPPTPPGRDHAPATGGHPPSPLPSHASAAPPALASASHVTVYLLSRASPPSPSPSSLCVPPPPSLCTNAGASARQDPRTGLRCIAPVGDLPPRPATKKHPASRRPRHQSPPPPPSLPPSTPLYRALLWQRRSSRWRSRRKRTAEFGVCLGVGSDAARSLPVDE
ncbi:hypothetical protein BRADI_3g07940v3 [Brachypodium distachyon]|uniref:Uncharacterized protein n=1 Tax=Brachypodium distachyon TaxID=15368 RepID=A0A2K2CVV1_BRADI|nr:hypothetical protein BRADI_3g07940v3 [Brachypodium distachyon]